MFLYLLRPGIDAPVGHVAASLARIEDQLDAIEFRAQSRGSGGGSGRHHACSPVEPATGRLVVLHRRLRYRDVMERN